MKIIFQSFLLVLLSFHGTSQNASDILERTRDQLQGTSIYAELEIDIIRADWERTVELKTWSHHGDYALIFVTAPKRERGTAFIKNKEEVINYQPNIDKAIKLPPSMMMQSWMGSDFSNDFLLQSSSLLNDYAHTYEGTEAVSGRSCHKISLLPRKDADVFWGRIVLWIDKKAYVQLRTEFYDEDGLLVNTVTGSNMRQYDGIWMPSLVEIRPAEGEEELTRVRYKAFRIQPQMDTSIFTVEHVKSML